MRAARKVREEAVASTARPVSGLSEPAIAKILNDRTTGSHRGHNDELGAYMARFKAYPVLKSRDDYKFLFEAYQSPDKVKSSRARDLIVYGNVKLILSIALRYSGRGLPLLDLMQEGYFGLQRAIEKFDVSLGNAFSTYAFQWVRREIWVALRDTSSKREYRIPAHYQEALALVRRTCMELYMRLARWPKNLEVYQAIKALETKKAQELSLSDVVQMMRGIHSGKNVVRLDAPYGDEGGDETNGDHLFTGPPKTETIVEARRMYIEYSRALERIEAAVSELPPRSAQVVRLRLGLGDFEAMTLDEIGERYGVTRERIRQIEEAAYRGTATVQGLETRLGITKEQIAEIVDVTQDLEVVAHAL